MAVHDVASQHTSWHPSSHAAGRLLLWIPPSSLTVTITTALNWRRHCRSRARYSWVGHVAILNCMTLRRYVFFAPSSGWDFIYNYVKRILQRFWFSSTRSAVRQSTRETDRRVCSRHADGQTDGHHHLDCTFSYKERRISDRIRPGKHVLRTCHEQLPRDTYSMCVRASAPRQKECQYQQNVAAWRKSASVLPWLVTSTYWQPVVHTIRPLWTACTFMSTGRTQHKCPS